MADAIDQFLADPNAADFTPISQPGLSASEAAQVDARTAQRTSPGAPTLRQKLGEQGNVPLNMEDGLGAVDKFNLAQRRTEQDKIRYLAGKYGAQNVRLNDNQEPIVRVPNPATGQPMDVLVNERGLSMSDLGTVAGHYPELLGMMIGPAAFEKAGAALFGAAYKLPRSMQALSTSFGAGAGGAVMDIATRAGDAATVDLPEVFQERGKNILADTALQKGGEFIAKAGTVGVQALRGEVPSPFKNLRGPIQNELADASDRIFDKTGIRYEPTLGQSTGNPLIAGTEQYLESQPAGAGPIRAGIQRTERQRQAIQDFMVSPNTLPLDETVGRSAIGILQSQTESADAAVKAAKLAIQEEGQTGIQDLLVQRFNKTAAPQPQIVGAGLRDVAYSERETFRGESKALYNEMLANPLSHVPDIPAKPVSAIAKDILKGWPRDPVTGELLTANAPAGMLKRLQEAAGLGGHMVETTTGADEFGPIVSSRFVEGRMSLAGLHALRKFADQDIKTGQAIAGIKDQELIALRGALTDTIEKGVKGTPLEPLWRNANDFYAKNVTRFTDKNIATLFRDPEQTSFVGDSDFLKSVIGNTDKYQAVQSFFGRSSEQMRLVNRYIADKIMRQSLVSGGGEAIDSQALRTAMAQLKSSDPKIFYGVFGKRGQDMLTHMNALDAANQLKGNVSARDLTKALDQSTLSRPNVETMLDAQRDAEKLYSNNIIKKFVKGGVGVEAIQGEAFVNNWLGSADVSDVKQVIDKVRAANPDTANELGRKALQKFFTDASRKGTPADILRGLKGDTTSLPSGVAMGEALKGDNGAKLELLLGKPQMDLLRDYVRVELSEDEKRRLAQGAGLLAKGTTIGSLLRLGVTGKEVSSYAKTKFLSYLISNPSFNKLLSSNYTAKEIPALARVIIASEPFATAVAQDLKTDSGMISAVAELKNGVMKAMGSGNQTPNQPAAPSDRGQSIDNFLNN